jgi:uncharacterized RDD family membrane protein YckC
MPLPLDPGRQAIDFAAAGIRHQDAGQNLDSSGFASAIGTNVANQFAALHAEIYARQGIDRAMLPMQQSLECTPESGGPFGYLEGFNQIFNKDLSHRFLQGSTGDLVRFNSSLRQDTFAAGKCQQQQRCSANIRCFESLPEIVRAALSDSGNKNDQPSNARLPRRVAAMFYDSLLIIAIWMITTAIIVYALTHGEAVTGFAYQLLLYLEVYFFYVLFWRVKGQSLGMQVWKIRLLSNANDKVSYRECSIRFLVATLSLACFGLGFLWMLWDKDGLTWQDKVSGTRVVFLRDDP